MKLAVLSESSADEAALRILVDGLLGQKSEAIGLDKFAARPGWHGRLSVLPAVLKELHYHTDADALALVLDSDNSPVHEPAHEQPGGSNIRCRVCLALETIRSVQQQLRVVPGRTPLNVAVGLAVPCFEAWLCCGVDPHVTEAAWVNGVSQGRLPYDGKKLKMSVYRTSRVPLQVQTRRMTEEASRLVANLSDLERWFPNGFGALAKAVRSW